MEHFIYLKIPSKALDHLDILCTDALALYILLCKHVNTIRSRKTGKMHVCPGRRYLKDKLHIGQARLTTCIEQLERIGWIKVYREYKKPNIYAVGEVIEDRLIYYSQLSSFKWDDINPHWTQVGPDTKPDVDPNRSTPGPNQVQIWTQMETKLDPTESTNLLRKELTTKDPTTSYLTTQKTERKKQRKDDCSFIDDAIKEANKEFEDLIERSGGVIYGAQRRSNKK